MSFICLPGVERRYRNETQWPGQEVGLDSSDIDRSAWCGQRWSTLQDEPRHGGDHSVSVGVTDLGFRKHIPYEIMPPYLARLGDLNRWMAGQPRLSVPLSL